MATYTGSDKRLQYLFSETADIRDSLADFSGATAETAGTSGFVPAPQAGEQEKYLRGDGTWAEVQGGGGALPGQGYTGSDLILRDAEGNISGVWYIDVDGNWTEYTKGAGGGHSFGMFVPTVAETINNSFSINLQEVE